MSIDLFKAEGLQDGETLEVFRVNREHIRFQEAQDRVEINWGIHGMPHAVPLLFHCDLWHPDIFSICVIVRNEGTLILEKEVLLFPAPRLFRLAAIFPGVRENIEILGRVWWFPDDEVSSSDFLQDVPCY